MVSLQKLGISLLLTIFLNVIKSTEFSSTCLDSYVNFATALDLCKAEGKQLVSVRNGEENRILSMLLKTEKCTKSVNSTDGLGRVWLNYNHWKAPGKWFESEYPLLFTDWTQNRNSPKCLLLTEEKWKESRCLEHATKLLFCENRDDEDKGKYGLILKKDSSMSSIGGVLPSNGGLVIRFSSRSTTALRLKVLDNILTIQCYNYQAVQTSGMVERIIEAGPVETKMIHTKYLTSTTSGSISLHSKVKLMFHAKSDCALYNVRIYDTEAADNTEELEPTIGWQSYNWFIEGPYKFFITENIQISFYCKEGTFLKSLKQCEECPVGTYQNMRNMHSCKECPAKYRNSTDTGLTACTCPKGGCIEHENRDGTETNKNNYNDNGDESEKETDQGVIESKEGNLKNITADQATARENANINEGVENIEKVKNSSKAKKGNQGEGDEKTDVGDGEVEKDQNDEKGQNDEKEQIGIAVTTSPEATLINPNIKEFEKINNTRDSAAIQKTAKNSSDIVKICNPQTTNEPLYGYYKWDGIEVERMAMKPCYYGNIDKNKIVYRNCSQIGNLSEWNQPDFAQCETKVDYEINQMSQIEITHENAEEIADNLTLATSDIKSITRLGIVTAVSSMQQLSAYTDPNDAQILITIGSNLLEASSDNLRESKESLKKVISDIAAMMSESEGNKEILTKNVDIVTAKTRKNEDTTLKTADAGVSVPESLASLTNGVFLTIFKNAKLFKQVSEDEKMTVVSDFNFNEIEIKDSDSEIRLEFSDTAQWVVNDSHFVKCVFWDGDDWSENGCRYSEDDKACLCNHATPFTSILSFKTSNQTLGLELSNGTLYTEMACFSISILSCILLIVTITSIRGLRKLQSFKFHCNLALSLLLQFSGFLILDLMNPKGVGCIVIGIIVHWATLSAFLSMMAEAFSVYYAIVVVFDSHIRYVTLKLIAFCYGIPLCLVGTFAGATKAIYYKCDSGGFLTSPYKLYVMDIPIFLIVIINTVIFIIITYKTIKLRIERSGDTFDRAQIISQLKMTFTLNTLLGLGFLLGLITHFSVILQLIFIIVNALSGLFLLCLFGIFNPMAREAIKKTLRLIPSSHTQTSSSYSYTPSKQNDPD